MDKNNQYFKKNETEFREYGLELEGLANNLDNNKSEKLNHIISEDELERAYKILMPFLQSRLLGENKVWDDLGCEDLINYEKWLEWWLTNLKEENYIMPI